MWQVRINTSENVDNIQQSIDTLRLEISKTIRELKTVRDENASLKAQLEKLRAERLQEQSTYQTLEDNYQKLKIASAMGGNPEHKKLMRHKMRQLIKEVDACIAEVKTKNI
ncbi:MAG: hypothetical protein Q4F57_05405 [Weeksellaceae bacterium]|nr:hypothetical protein [Weeksellaceae bacterium]